MRYGVGSGYIDPTMSPASLQKHKWPAIHPVRRGQRSYRSPPVMPFFHCFFSPLSKAPLRPSVVYKHFAHWRHEFNTTPLASCTGANHFELLCLFLALEDPTFFYRHSFNSFDWSLNNFSSVRYMPFCLLMRKAFFNFVNEFFNFPIRNHVWLE